jgi:hypothetical protein
MARNGEISIGRYAGHIYQEENSIAIGTNAGEWILQKRAIAIGNEAGTTKYGGSYSSYPFEDSICIGTRAIGGQKKAINIGTDVGRNLLMPDKGTTGEESVNIGYNAGSPSNKYAVAIGTDAGNSGFASLPSHSVHIGYKAFGVDPDHMNDHPELNPNCSSSTICIKSTYHNDAFYNHNTGGGGIHLFSGNVFMQTNMLYENNGDYSTTDLTFTTNNYRHDTYRRMRGYIDGRRIGVIYGIGTSLPPEPSNDKPLDGEIFIKIDD